MRRGLGRADVLVLAALLAVTVALFLPKVQTIRCGTAAEACRNNLRQLAVAAQGYADAGHRGYFPPGTVPHPALPPGERLSWIVPLLPYLEHDHLYRRLDRAAGAAANRPVAAVVKGLLCPAREAPAGDPVTHFVGVAGVGADAAELPAGDRRAGVFGHDRLTRPADIADGLANTLLFIEVGANPGHWPAGGPATVRAIDPADEWPVGPGRAFGRTHAGGTGAHVALADGSVRTVFAADAPAVLPALATAAGGEAVPADW